jgi:K(+)-stimulated pyrophosphate-energized sodium pump
MNILIKLTSIVALIIAPHIAQKELKGAEKDFDQPRIESVTPVDNSQVQ